MDLRFKLAAVGFIVAMVLLSKFDHQILSGFGGVFVTLGGLLIFVFVALWPSLSRGDMVDRTAAGGSWSDRIEFDNVDGEDGRKS